MIWRRLLDAFIAREGVVAKKRRPKFYVWRSSKDRLWRFVFIAANGERIPDGYVRKIDCMNGLELVQREAADAEVVVETFEPPEPKRSARKRA